MILADLDRYGTDDSDFNEGHPSAHELVPCLDEVLHRVVDG